MGDNLTRVEVGIDRGAARPSMSVAGLVSRESTGAGSIILNVTNSSRQRRDDRDCGATHSLGNVAEGMDDVGKADKVYKGPSTLQGPRHISLFSHTIPEIGFVVSLSCVLVLPRRGITSSATTMGVNPLRTGDVHPFTTPEVS